MAAVQEFRNRVGALRRGGQPSGCGGGSRLVEAAWRRQDGLELDRHHVLKIANRACLRLSKESSLSKYSPLPQLKVAPHGGGLPGTKPQLLRERTYHVLEPIFVKGPIQQDKEVKLPDIKKPPGKSNSQAFRTTGQLSTPKRNKILGSSAQMPSKRTRQTSRFCPDSVDIPADTHPQLFWFPI